MKELKKIELNTSKSKVDEKKVKERMEKEIDKQLKILEIKERKNQEYQTAKIISNCFTEANYRNYNFENFVVDDDNSKLYSFSKQYINNFEENKRKNIGFAFFGGVGSGKTFLACCIANDLLDKGYSVIFRTMSEILNDLRNLTLNKGSSKKYIEEINDCDLLIIDDLGVENKTEFITTQLYDLFNKRYVQGKPLIITTNLDTAININKNDNVEITRIKSRIIGMCTIIKVKGKDRRIKIQYDKLQKLQNDLK